MWLNKFSSDLLIDIDIIYILYTMKEHVVSLLISILNTMSFVIFSFPCF